MGRLLILSSEFPPAPGGMGMYAYGLAAALARQGVDVSAATVEGRAEAEACAAFEAKSPFPTHRFPADARSLIGRRLRDRAVERIARREGATCLMSSGRRSAWTLREVARRLRLPLVAIGYGSEFMDTVPRRLRRTLRAFSEAECLIVPSGWVAQKAAHVGIDRDRIRVIHPGVTLEGQPATDEAVEELRRNLGLEGKRVILTVGRVSARKAQDVVIRAMSRLVTRHPDAVYVIAGQPDYRSEFEGVAEEAGVSDAVRFVGVVPQEALPCYYRLCDVFVLNSRIDEHGNVEGFGMVLIEAGLAERPVIGTRNCGVEDAVEHGVTGFLVEQDAPDQTADAIIRLLDDPALAQRLGANGLKRAREYFTWERAAEQCLDLLRPWVNSENT